MSELQLLQKIHDQEAELIKLMEENRALREQLEKLQANGIK
jgi:cell division protein FtsB